MMLCLLFVLIDQIIKAYIVAEKPVKVIIPDIIKIVYSENTGTVFGLAPGSNSMLCIVAIVIIIALGLLIFFTTEKYSSKRRAFQLILAGGIGNLIDRFYRGCVIDYVKLKFFGVCNLADFLIVIGVVWLLIANIYELNNGREINEDRREI